jgi:hypothetical protein
LQIGKQFVVSAQVDQNFNNNPNESLWALLANPATDANLYAYNLQRLVNDFPQSGMLQALLAHASEHKNLRQASVYFNPRSLFKLINAPATFVGVPEERIVVQAGIGVNGTYTNNEPQPVFESTAPTFTAEPATGVSEESHPYTPEELNETVSLEAMPPLDYEAEATPELPHETIAEIHHEPEASAEAHDEAENLAEAHDEPEAIIETPHEPETNFEAPHEPEVTTEEHHKPEAIIEAHHEITAINSPIHDEYAAHHSPEELTEAAHEAVSPEEEEAAELVKAEARKHQEEFSEVVADEHAAHEPEIQAVGESIAEEAVEQANLIDHQEEITPVTGEHDEVAAAESQEPAEMQQVVEPVTEEVSPVTEEAPAEVAADIVDHEAEKKANPYYPYESEEAWREEEGIPQAIIIPADAYEEPAVETVDEVDEPTVQEPETHFVEAEPATAEVAAEAVTHEEPPIEEVASEPGEVTEHWPEDKAATEDVAAEVNDPAHWPEDKFTSEVAPEAGEPAVHEPEAQVIDEEIAPAEIPEVVAHEEPVTAEIVEESAPVEALHEQEEEVEQEIPVEHASEPEPLIPLAGEMDETFDEIVGIEDINFNGQSDNFFSFEEEFGAHEDDTAPVTAQADAEQQDMSRYHDETMPYSFMWWLDKTRKEHSHTYQPYVKKTTAPPVEEKKQKKAIDELQQQYYENIFHITSPVDELEKPAAPSPSPTARPQPAPAHHEPKRKEHVIIDRFIKEEPQIRPQSSDKLDNENKAKKSSEDRDELVTETLAMIYSDQMLYHKAISSYKKLMLKFPEKTRYFADKIELLEKKTQ